MHFAHRLKLTLDSKKSSTMQSSLEEFSIPRHKFKFINAQVAQTDSDRSEIRDTIRRIILEHVIRGNVFPFDELVVPHAEKYEALIAFLERKPHPLGILFYLSAQLLRVTRLPIIVDIIPVDSAPKSSGPVAFADFLQRLGDDPARPQIPGLYALLSHIMLLLLIIYRIHVVVDSLFPTEMTKTIAIAQGLHLTFSQNAAHNENLTRGLDHKLVKGEYRIVARYDEKSHFVELQYAYYDSAIVHGGSTAYCPTDEVISIAPYYSPTDARQLAGLSFPLLIKVCVFILLCKDVF